MVALAWDTPWRGHEGADSDAFIGGMSGVCAVDYREAVSSDEEECCCFLSMSAADRDAAASVLGGAAYTLLRLWRAERATWRALSWNTCRDSRPGASRKRDRHRA